MLWGLIPSWAKDPDIGNRMINARAETLAEKPVLRAALKKRMRLTEYVSRGWFLSGRVNRGWQCPAILERRQRLRIGLSALSTVIL
jgi:hypothetical protein